MKQGGFAQSTQDGRRLRSLASRDRIISTVIEMVEDGGTALLAETIAARAGVGLRTLFRHFGDMDSLYNAVMARIEASYSDLARPYDAPDWRGQLRESTERRLHLYRSGLKYRQAADQFRAASAVMQARKAALDRLLRQRLEGILLPVLANDRDRLEAIDLAISLDTYGRLRGVQGLGHDAAGAVMRLMVEQLLAGVADG